MAFFSEDAVTGWQGLLRRLVVSMERKNDAEAPKDTSPTQPSSNYIPMTVETFDNHIYFYADVDTDRCLDLIRKIRETDNELRRQATSRMLPDDHPPVPIWLHIQSNGGELFTGLNIADQISKIQTPIYSIVEGMCASAATLISLAANKRYILPSSFMLIHQITSWGWGRIKYDELKDEMHLQNMLVEQLYSFYSKRTMMNKTTIKKLLKKDSWFNAEQCIELGLADVVVE